MAPGSLSTLLVPVVSATNFLIVCMVSGLRNPLLMAQDSDLIDSSVLQMNLFDLDCVASTPQGCCGLYPMPML